MDCLTAPPVSRQITDWENTCSKKLVISLYYCQPINSIQNKQRTPEDKLTASNWTQQQCSHSSRIKCCKLKSNAKNISEYNGGNVTTDQIFDNIKVSLLSLRCYNGIFKKLLSFREMNGNTERWNYMMSGICFKIV